MLVGNLRHRVTFKKKQTSKDSSGQDVHTWVTFSPSIVRSASIKPIKGQESVEARGVYSQVLFSIMVRYDPETATITNDHRIDETDDATRIFAIHNVINIEERNEWLEFWCSEGLQDRN